MWIAVARWRNAAPLASAAELRGFHAAIDAGEIVMKGTQMTWHDYTPTGSLF